MKQLRALLGLSVVVAGALGATASAAGPVRALALGAAAPDFDLPGVDGRQYRLQDFDDAKVLVVLFTCNHCPTARTYEGRIKRLAADYKSKGVAFVAISPNDPKAVRLNELGYTDLNDSFEEMKIRAAHAKFNFPYLYDGETQRAARAYGPVATPHLFIFDAQRTLRYVGRIDDSEVEKRVKRHDAREALDALLAGKAVEVAKTKTFGCSIKWADKRAANERFMKKLAAEPVTLEMADAKQIKALRTNRSGKLRVISVWATRCGPCVAEFPELVTINRMYRHREFEMVTISADAPARKAKVLAFLKKQQASNRNLHFSSDDAYKLMAALDKEWEGGLPYLLVIGPDSKVVYRHTGQIDSLALRRLIVERLGPYRE